MADRRRITARPIGRSAGTVTARRKPEGRRPSLYAALDLSLGQPFEAGVRTATEGGPLAIGLRNTGLAPSFQGFVELRRVIYRLRPPVGRGVFVLQTREGASSFWRRALRGEVLAPDRTLAHSRGRDIPGDGVTFSPERLVSADPQDRREALLSRTWAGIIAPRESVSLVIEVPAMPDRTEPEGVWSWCLVARCFDVLQEPPAPVVLPTPLQAAHHTRLLCLHDTID